MPLGEDRPPGPYARFNVLLDDPAEHPGLGFDDYAAALAEMIVHSRAEFAIGIFGSWGSGKTTLMRTIEKILAGDPSVVPVWFAAWRYEKDPNLILPLLDVLREALEAEAAGQSGWARDAASAVSRAGLAFLAGLQLSASLPGAGADLDIAKMIESIKAGRKHPRALSFYHAGFRMLSDAIRGLSAGGARRVVIFVDDLDRCLPANALDVLESMKLFFDVQGCVFVVGLDQEIAERAVAVKYRDIAADTGLVADEATPPEPNISGTDYVKKMFQVPFALPRISTSQLQDYLDAIERNSDFGDAQRRDFRDNVRRHFTTLQGEDSVNPREIKRLINTYTLQVKMLSPRLGESLDPNVVLALQCMNFRAGWRTFYEQLSADPQFFQRAVREVLDEPGWPEWVWLGGTRHPLPTDLTEYLRGLGACVLNSADLQAYVLFAESTWTTDPWVLEARTVVTRLQRVADELAARSLTVEQAVRRILVDLDRLQALVVTRREARGPRLRVLRRKLEGTLDQLMNRAKTLVQAAETDPDPEAFVTKWAQHAVPLVNALDDGLREWHRSVDLGA